MAGQRERAGGDVEQVDVAINEKTVVRKLKENFEEVMTEETDRKKGGEMESAVGLDDNSIPV